MVSIKDFADQTIYNKRTAEANAISQTGGKMGGSDANTVNNQQYYQQQQQQLANARTTYNTQGPVQAVNGVVSAAPTSTPGGVGSTGGVINQLRDIRQAGQEGYVDAKGSVINGGIGVLQGATNGDNALAAAATPAQIAQNQQNLKGIANVGFGVSPLERSEAAKLEAQQQEANGATAYRMQKNSDGTTSWVVDQEGSAKAQQDVKNRQAQQNAADAANAQMKNDANKQNAPVPTIDSFLASVPEEQKQEASAIFQPLFDWIDQQKGALGEQQKEGMDSINSLDATAQEYFSKQKDQNDTLFKYFAQMNKDALDRQLEISKNVHDSQLRDAEYQKDRSQSLYDRAIRDQIIKNEEDRKNQMMSLGISGGWRASRQTADVISALAKGDRILSDLYTDAAFASRDATNGLMKVEDTYHNNVLTAYDGYYNGNAKLFNDFNGRAGELDKTIFNTMKEKNDAITQLNKDYIKGYGDLAGTFAKTVSDENKYVLDSAKDLQKQQFDQRKDIWNEANDYIAKFGTQNRTQLSYYEQALGLNAGSLSDQKTLAELRLNKGLGGGGTGGSDLTQISDFAQNQMAALDQIYPGKSREEKAKLVLNSWDSRFGGTKAGKVGTGKMADYLNTFYGQGYVPNDVQTGYSGPEGKPDSPFFIVPDRSPLVEVSTGDVDIENLYRQLEERAKAGG